MITSFFISKPPLQQIINERNGDITEFTYDPWDNLVSATYEQHQQLLTIYKAPDAIGNLFETQNQTDRKYQSAQLQHDGKWYYHYDKEGNLIQKSPCKLHNEKNAQKWSLGVWQYTWNANGSLKSVKKPSGQTISFEYDALGRRTAKRSGNKEILYIWSGNVLLQEVLKTNDNEQVITWVYEQGNFVPTAKLIDNKSFSIVSDYIGKPVLAFDENGEKVWSAEYDIYGKLTNLQGDKAFIPFRQLGQYEDVETGLYYNRFRYYDPNTGSYISQDPIGLLGNNPNIYAYVFDSNTEVDVFGLRGKEGFPSWMDKKMNYERHHIIPYEHRNHEIFKITGMNVNNATNMMYLPTKESVHQTKAVHHYFKINGKSHKEYNKLIRTELDDLMKFYNSEKWDVERLRKELLELQHTTRKKLNNARSHHH